MILGKNQILKRIKEGSLIIKPFDESLVNPAGIDLRLSGIKSISYPNLKLTTDEKMLILPNETVLSSTLEWIEMPVDLVGLIGLRSTWMRKGLKLAGLTVVDPGYKGNLTIQLSAARETELRFGDAVFNMLLASAIDAVPYTGKYSQSRGVVDAK
jgi:dCTP deaminase